MAKIIVCDVVRAEGAVGAQVPGGCRRRHVFGNAFGDVVTDARMRSPVQTQTLII